MPWLKPQDEKAVKAAFNKVLTSKSKNQEEFVEAYVAYTHYVERLHKDATAKGAHGEHNQP